MPVARNSQFMPRHNRYVYTHNYIKKFNKYSKSTVATFCSADL